jgi:hypothetical protein
VAKVSVTKYFDLFARAGSYCNRDAALSDDLRYRYRLSRWWNDEQPWACFWMLNPSTADAAVDDPTIRRCMRFASRENCGGMMVVNWFAYRATNPAELTKAAKPFGIENRRHIIQAVGLCQGPIIAAWGANALVTPRLRFIPELVGDRKLVCLGKNKYGSPKHPLYIPSDAPLVPFEIGGAA